MVDVVVADMGCCPFHPVIWDKRADDPVIDGKTSIVECQKLAHGFRIIGPKQPLIRYSRMSLDGQLEQQFQAPELMVMGHTFKDLSTRVGAIGFRQPCLPFVPEAS